jgi:peptide/nickel transport system permease protein
MAGVRYISGRLLQALITILLLLTFVFLAVRATGDPTATLLPEEATDMDRAAMRQYLHLDEPVWRQYTSYVADVARGKFGTSYKYQQPVTGLILDRLPVTATLTALSALFTLGLGLPLGIISAQRRGKPADSLILFVALLGQSVPVFVTALAGILFFSVKLRWLPVAGVDSPLGYVLPVATLSWFGIATIIRVTRVSMLNVLGMPYIVTARAKGLRSASIIYIHALRNALIPIVTVFGLILATLLTGAVVTETMFGLPGLGRLVVDSIVSRDFPVVQAIIVFISSSYVLINLIIDILYGIVDPRAWIGAR